jgi:hypothetical protein
MVREHLGAKAELKTETAEPTPLAAAPEAQPSAEETEEKLAPQAEEKQAEEKAQPQVEEKREAAPGDGLYRGMLELDVTAEDAKQIPIFLSQLQQLPNLQVVSFKGLPGGNSLIMLAISHPIPLPSIIKRMPPVESVKADEQEVHVVLKGAAF